MKVIKTLKLRPWGHAECGPDKQVVFIYKWPLEKVTLYTRTLYEQDLW